MSHLKTLDEEHLFCISKIEDFHVENTFVYQRSNKIV